MKLSKFFCGNPYRSEYRNLTIVPWIFSLIACITLYFLSDYFDSLQNINICGMKQFTSYHEYMKILGQKQSEWQELNYKEAQYFQLGRQIQNCQTQINQLNQIAAEGSQQLDKREIIKIHQKIFQCRTTIDEGLQRIKRSSIDK